jgi:hypothetical protein
VQEKELQQKNELLNFNQYWRVQKSFEIHQYKSINNTTTGTKQDGCIINENE